MAFQAPTGFDPDITDDEDDDERIRSLFADPRFSQTVSEARAKGISDERIKKSLIDSGATKLSRPFTDVADDKEQSYLSMFGNLISEGFEQSSTAILTGQGPTAKRMREQGLRDYNWFQKAILGTASVISDIPIFAAGEIIGTGATANPLVGAGLAFALPAAIRETWNAYAEFKEENPNSDFTIGEFIDNIDEIATETGREAIVGVVTSGAGKIMKSFLSKPANEGLFNSVTIDGFGQEFRNLTKTGRAAAFAGEAAALTAASSGVRGELPTVDQLVENVTVLGGVKISHKLASGILRLSKQSGADPVEVANNLTPEQVAKLEASENFSERVKSIVSQRVEERGAAAAEGRVEAEQVAAKEKVKRGAEIAKELKRDVKQLDIQEQRSIEATERSFQQETEKVNKKINEKIEKLTVKDEKVKKEIQDKFSDIQKKTSQEAIESKARVALEAEKFDEKAVKFKEKIQKQSEKEISRLEKARDKEIESARNEKQKSVNEKLKQENKSNKFQSQRIDLKEQARLATAKTENQKKAIKRQTQQQREDLQRKHQENIQNLENQAAENNPAFEAKKNSIERAFKRKIESEQKKLAKSQSDISLATEKQKQDYAKKLKNEFLKSQKKANEELVKYSKSQDKATSKQLDKILKESGAIDKLDNQRKKVVEKEQQKYEKQRDRAKQKAFKRWQNVKESFPTGYDAVTRDGNRVQVIKSKKYNRQDYVLKNGKVEMRRPVDQNARDIIDNQVTLENIANTDVSTLEGNAQWLKKVSDALNSKTLGKMFIDIPFKSIGADETGFRVKNYYTKQLALQDRLVRNLKETVREGKFTETELQELILLSEKDKLPKEFQEKFGKAYKGLRDVFDTFGKELQQQGTFEKLFPFSRISYNEGMIEQLTLQLEGVTNKAEIKSIRNEIQRMSEDNAAMKNLRFVSIPMSMFWEEAYQNNPIAGSKMLRALTAAGRKSFSLTDLLASGAIKQSDINFDNIMATYGKKAARDIALFDIINAAKGDGLVSSTPKPTFVQLSALKYPLLAKQFAHPAFADFLSDFTNQKPQGFVSRLLSKAKGFAFFNPMILPIYDVYQGAMLGSYNIFKPVKTVSNFVKGMKSLINQDVIFQQAEENGLFSSPFDRTFDDFKSDLIKSRTYFGEGVKAPLSEFLSDFVSQDNIKSFGLKAMYDWSSKIAWLGDRAVRMGSYYHLLGEGLAPRDAAQISALFHADYSAVNPKLRKSLNNFFFTPTFKLAMGRLYGNMMREAAKKPFVDSTKNAYQKKISDIKAMGLVNTAGVIFGTHLLMNSLGFQTQQLGRKYFAKMQTDEGEKELVVTFSNPTNLFLKFFYRGKEALDPLNTNTLEGFYQAASWEIHPIWRTLIQARDNKSVTGDAIYNELGDRGIVKVAKTLKYGINQLLPAITKAEEAFEPAQVNLPSNTKANKVLADEFGRFGEFAFDFFGFNYLRSTQEMRDGFRIKQVINKFKSDVRKGNMTKRQIAIAQERIDKIIRNYNDLKQLP